LSGPSVADPPTRSALRGPSAADPADGGTLVAWSTATQPVAEIVGPMQAGEDDLREFLRLLADQLERGAPS
jgi:hypothetical protein